VARFSATFRCKQQSRFVCNPMNYPENEEVSENPSVSRSTPQPLPVVIVH
jgi:hypothetical protein